MALRECHQTSKLLLRDVLGTARCEWIVYVDHVGTASDMIAE
jgi:hypothetical protein